MQLDLTVMGGLVMVTGGRPQHYWWRPNDAEWLRVVLLDVEAKQVVHGGARGVDQETGQIAEEMGLEVVCMPADWEQDPDAGKARNVAMLDLVPKLVISFPGGPGTRHATQLAHSRGIVVLYRY